MKSYNMEKMGASTPKREVDREIEEGIEIHNNPEKAPLRKFKVRELDSMYLNMNQDEFTKAVEEAIKGKDIISLTGYTPRGGAKEIATAYWEDGELTIEGGEKGFVDDEFTLYKDPEKMSVEDAVKIISRYEVIHGAHKIPEEQSGPYCWHNKEKNIHFKNLEFEVPEDKFVEK